MTEELYLVKRRYGKTEERVYDVAARFQVHSDVYFVTADGHRVTPEWSCKLSELLYKDPDFGTIEPIIGEAQ